MKHLLFLLTLAWALPTLVGAQTVAEDILKGSQIQGIEFKNYVGPHKVIETRLAIQGIGADLGRQMKVPGALKADYAGKYQIQRIHDPASPLLSADVLILGPDAGVDHIRNLNWIVSAYLQQAFGYSVTDADLLANFVTRYNAFYRGKVDYVKATYIPAVGEAVTAETLGLSTVWSEWAGKTRMLIPLRDSLSKGLAGSLNTEEVSNKDIVTQMAQDPGKGLDDRKKLADLKEGEIVQEQKAVAQAEAKSPAVPSGTGTTAAGPTTTAPTLPGSTAAPATNPPTATSGPAATPSPTPTPTLPQDQA
ncbi:MAG TPA: P83/100 family protein, partial [Spirochaetia bacterium]|nr:P83/100 family protein [Spirochaetia bacterium]